MRALAAMPRKDRHEILALLDFWRDLSRERRAMLAKIANPDLTDQQVSRLVGRTPRQLRRWKVYKRLKGKQADLRDGRSYRGFSDPDAQDE